MTIFAVIYRYTDDVATRDRFRAAHRDYLRGLADRGVLLVSGRFGPDEPPGALLMVRAGSKDDIRALVADDPFSVHGVVAEAEMIEWEPLIGPLLSAM
jgi:uncharacterized protein